MVLLWFVLQAACFFKEGVTLGRNPTDYRGATPYGQQRFCCGESAGQTSGKNRQNLVYLCTCLNNYCRFTEKKELWIKKYDYIAKNPISKVH